MDNLSDDIIKYKKGDLSPEQMHALEKKALADPFLAEALEGVENISPEELTSDISDIEKKILRKKKTIFFTPLRIAAGVLVVTASIFIVYQFVPKAETIALKTEKPKPENKKEDEKPSVTSGNTIEKAEPKKLNNELNNRKTKKNEAPPVPKSNSPATEISKSEEPVKQNPSAQTQPSIQQEPVQDLAIVEEQSGRAETEDDKVSKEVVTNDSKAAGAGAVSRAKKMDIAASEAQPSSAPASKFQGVQSISGQVFLAEDNTPLPGVNVNVKGTSIGTVTDLKGNYTIPVARPNQQLVFSFIGLQQQEVNASGKNEIDVKMKDDPAQLSEIVVTGYGLKKEDDRAPIIISAAPEGGRKAYDKYLESNLKYPEEALKNKIKGKAGIEFTVSTDGSLYDFKVIKKLGYGCEEEIIRLVKEGPKWIPSTEDSKPTESTVRVRMRFDPAKSGR